MSKDNQPKSGSPLPKSLTFHIRDGRIYAQPSRNLGEFEVGVEIVELLRLLDSRASEHRKGWNPQSLSRQLVQGLDEAKQCAPNPHSLEILLADLHQSGVLQDRNQKAVGAGEGMRFADPWIQWAMLADEVRTRRYEAAIREVAPQGKTCVEIGAGSGILTAFLLQAGAHRVIAIEESAAAQHLLRQIRGSLAIPEFELKSRLEIQAVNSQDAALPPKADVIVSELFGHDPFSEGMVPAIRNVQNRLKGKFTSIPQAVRVKVALVEVTDGPIKLRLLAFEQARQEATIRKSADLYHQFLARYRSLQNWETLSFPEPLRAKDFRQISPESLVFHLNLDPIPRKTSDSQQGELKAVGKIPNPEKSGPICLILWFEAKLTAKQQISSHPQAQDACPHWAPVVIPILHPWDPHKRIDVNAQLSECETHLHLEVWQQKKLLAAR